MGFFKAVRHCHRNLTPKLNTVPLPTEDVQYFHQNNNTTTKVSNLCAYLWSELSIDGP